MCLKSNLFYGLLLISLGVFGQTFPPLSFDSISPCFTSQLELFPQEKVYVHTDKPCYISGETVWLRTFLVDAVSHTAQQSSRYIYVELINPLDSVVQRVKIRPDEGLFYGYLKLNENLPDGIYTLRAYTAFMRNVDETYLFRKKIIVKNPVLQSASARADIHLSNDGEKAYAELQFINAEGSSFKPKNLIVKYGDKEIYHTWNRKDSVIKATIPLEPGMKEFYVESGNLQQFISLPCAENEFDVSFFPEGGRLIEGADCRIAFKALNGTGLGEEVSVEVFNDKNVRVTTAESLHKGMGFFQLIPDTGRSYYALCRNEAGIVKRFELPAVERGYSLKIVRKKDDLLISVMKSPDMPEETPLYVLAHVRGVVQSFFAYDFTRNYAVVDTKDFPSGVVQILLLDGMKNPLSERLTFCLNDRDFAQVEVTTDKAVYDTREKVQVDVSLTDITGNPIEGNFSVSVTDDSDLAADTLSSIATYLLLSSELRGYIESPSYYFQKGKAESLALDILMLTQGWRRYDVPSLLQGRYLSPVYPLEIGQEIAGKVNEYGWFKIKKGRNVPVSIIAPHRGYVDITATDDNGKFCFNGFELPDSTRYIVQALIPDKNKDLLEIHVSKDTFPEMHTRIPNEFSYNRIVSEEYLPKANMKYSYENGIRTVYLDNVTITARRKVDRVFPYLPDKTFKPDEIIQSGASNIYDLLRRVAGVRIVPTKFGSIAPYDIYLRDGLTSIILDGTFVSYVFMGEKIEYDLTLVSMQDIESIQVLKGGNATIFGARAPAGAIIINTKRGDWTGQHETSTNMAEILPLGYQQAAKFYSPKYEVTDKKPNKNPDLRTTIFWDPSIKIRKDGKNSFNFYTADGLGTYYSVLLQGISSDGKIIIAKRKIKID